MPTLKSNRLEIRLTHDQKAEIEQAAAISGRSVSDFSVSILTHEAADVIRRDRDLAMSEAAWAAFNEALDRPARTVDSFARLLARPSLFVD